MFTLQFTLSLQRNHNQAFLESGHTRCQALPSAVAAGLGRAAAGAGRALCAADAVGRTAVL